MDVNLPLHILLTKADKLKHGARQKVIQQTRKQLQNDGISVSAFSALSGDGLQDFEAVCDRFLQVEE